MKKNYKITIGNKKDVVELPFIASNITNALKQAEELIKDNKNLEILMIYKEL